VKNKNVDGNRFGAANINVRNRNWNITKTLEPIDKEHWHGLFVAAQNDHLVETGLSVPQLHQIEARQARSNIVTFPGRTFKVLSWNLREGSKLDELWSIPHFRSADILLLNEVDMGMARSGNRHLAREIADHLGYSYAYVVDYLEDTIGTHRQRKQCRGRVNDYGFSGKAIISRYPLLNVRGIRLPETYSTLRDTRRRIGSSVVLMADIRTSQGQMTLAVVQLSGRGNPLFRRLQMSVMMDRLPLLQPCLIGGDFNTHTLDGSRSWSYGNIPWYFMQDTQRFKTPQRYEPLFKFMMESGFRFSYFNDHKATWHAPYMGSLLKSRLDWFCGSSLIPLHSESVPALDDKGRRIIDRDGIWLECRP